MLEVYLTIFFISVLLIFLGSGVWVGISMIGVSTIGMMMFTSRPVGDAMATTMWSMGSSWSLTALPLFVWMGEILFRTKLSENEHMISQMFEKITLIIMSANVKKVLQFNVKKFEEVFIIPVQFL